MQQTQDTAKLLTVSEFARLLGVKPSYVTQLINDHRIPEARRDPEDNRYRIPNRRCIIPSKHPKKGRKVNEFFFRRDEIPEEWVEDPDRRPEPGVVLEGDESEPLGDRIARTFGLPVGRQGGDTRAATESWWKDWDVRGKPGDRQGDYALAGSRALELLSLLGVLSGASRDRAVSWSRSGGRPKSVEIDLATWKESEELRSIVDAEGLKEIGIDLEALSGSEKVRGIVLLYE